MKARTIIEIVTAIVIVWLTLFVEHKFFPASTTYRDAQAQEDISTVNCNKLSNWQMLIMSIMKTESDFNPLAIGTSRDIGVLQITPVYVKEVNALMDTTLYTHTDAFDVVKSIEMFNCLQNARNPEHDFEKAIRLHNPNGDSIGYMDKVLSNFRWFVRMEQIRQEVIKYEKL